jgi:hypothetical protein
MTVKNTPDRNSRDPITDEPPNQKAPDEPQFEDANPPMKGRDIPATTNLEYIDREKGKRTTM